MKKNTSHHRKRSHKTSVRQRNALYYTFSLLCLALLIIGVYFAGSRYDPLNSDSSTSSAFETPVPTKAAEISQRSDPTESPEPTELITPTDQPVSYPDKQLEVSKLGWAYTAGGSEGKPAVNTDKRIEMCKRFGGIWQGDTSKKKIYITMDVGYEHNGNTAKILDIARRKDFKINFFIVGKLFTYPQYKELILRIHNEGHVVASHSWNHDMYDEMYKKSGAQAIRDDLKKVEDAYFELTGSILPKYFRFPSAEYSEAALDAVHRAGYTSVFWSFSYRDWLINDQPDPEESLQNIINNLHNGLIMLLHPVSDTNAAILSDLVDAIRARGYEIATLDEFE